MLGYPDIRLAGPEDKRSLMELTPMIHAEIGSFAYSERKIDAIVEKAVEHKGGFVGVAGPHEGILGCVCLVLDQMSYSDDWLLVELWNYVEPASRKTDIGQQLINFAKDVSRKLSLKLFIGVLNNVRTEAKIRLYDRSLPRAGAYYIFDPANENERGGSPDVPHTIYVPRSRERKLQEIAKTKGCNVRDLLTNAVAGIGGG